MKTISRLLIACFALSSLALASPLRAEAEKRIAFVVGNAAYQAGPLATPANDAGLIAQTLQAAGFDVAGARDLDGEALRAAFRDFLDKAQASGPDTVAFVYLAGYGAQLDDENYFVPVDANIAVAPDAAVEVLRVSDYTKRLAGLPLKASFIVLDAARASPFAKSGPPLAGGLALVDAEPNMLVAFNAAPGTAAGAESGSYGAYAQALAEMIREGGLSPGDVFDGVRLRVNETTKGAQVPWNTSRITAPFVFFERAPDAPPPALAQDHVNAMRSRPLRDLGAQDAYAAAIERDTLEGYEDFLGAYPTNPLANRVRALVAARREAITWQRTWHVNTPDAYWSYLDRYPRGPHAADARQRLATLAAPEEPPPSYAPISYD
ncbi:MAG: caspase domain-containing protein, partial [Methylocella sp.]